MNVLFIASMSVVAADPPRSRKLFIDALGLPLEKYEADEYYSSESIPGSKHFGVHRAFASTCSFAVMP